jgi:hypothetical protein
MGELDFLAFGHLLQGTRGYLLLSSDVGRDETVGSGLRLRARGKGLPRWGTWEVKKKKEIQTELSVTGNWGEMYGHSAL